MPIFARFISLVNYILYIINSLFVLDLFYLLFYAMEFNLTFKNDMFGQDNSMESNGKLNILI